MKIINIFFAMLTLYMVNACSETIHEYKVKKTKEQIYQNRLELYKENH